MTLVSRRVRPEQWKPIDVDALEPNALDVVRSVDNRCVIAGPGSGKTELLAQRASYLLQCGVAPPPKRILAISYKRDAATNLAARVRSRCHSDHAYRFDSWTFDAFAKSLIDRFGQALPERWRPRALMRSFGIGNGRDQGGREGQRKCCAPVRMIARRNGDAERVGKALDDRKPQPAAAVPVAALPLLECVEDCAFRSRFQTAAMVAHGQGYGIGRPAADDGDRPGAAAMLDRIGEQVEQNVMEQPLIDPDKRKTRGNLGFSSSARCKCSRACPARGAGR